LLERQRGLGKIGERIKRYLRRERNENEPRSWGNEG